MLHTRVFARRVRPNAVHQTIGMVHSTFAYGVEPHEEGTTLTLEVEHSVPIPVLGKLAEHISVRRNAREFELALVNVKEALEGSVGPFGSPNCAGLAVPTELVLCGCEDEGVFEGDGAIG